MKVAACLALCVALVAATTSPLQRTSSKSGSKSGSASDESKSVERQHEWLSGRLTQHIGHPTGQGNDDQTFRQGRELFHSRCVSTTNLEHRSYFRYLLVSQFGITRHCCARLLLYPLLRFCNVVFLGLLFMVKTLKVFFFARHGSVFFF
jgi:hypothetical protein